MQKLFHDYNKDLEHEIELYISSLHKAALTFYEGMKDYLFENEERFHERVHHTNEMEREADQHLKNLKFLLYKYNLIPDLSADILELMDALDDVADVSKAVMLDLELEKPEILEAYRQDFKEIAKRSLRCTEALLTGVRVFFTQIKAIEEHVEKVYFYEKEVDRMEYQLKKKIFENASLDLAQKMHLKEFVKRTAALSNISEDVALKLAVFKFKRGI